MVTNDSYLEYNIENKKENIDEKVDGDSNDIKPKQSECAILSMKINKITQVKPLKRMMTEQNYPRKSVESKRKRAWPWGNGFWYHRDNSKKVW